MVAHFESASWPSGPFRITGLLAIPGAVVFMLSASDLVYEPAVKPPEPAPGS